MARPKKIGLDYFPMDVGFFEDDKIQLIEAEFGIKGTSVAVRLLCKVYKNGYSYQWGDDECLLLCRQMGAGFVPSKMEEIVKGLVRRSLFDKGVFDSFRILTSRGIQKRYIEIASRTRGSVRIDPVICLIDGFPQENPSKPQENPSKPQFNATKEKKGKENKLKENGKECVTPSREDNGKFKDRLLSDGAKLEIYQMAFHVGPERLKRAVREYGDWLYLCERRPQTYGEYCKTFYSWFQIKLKENGREDKHNGQVDISANRPEDYAQDI